MEKTDLMVFKEIFKKRGISFTETNGCQPEVTMSDVPKDPEGSTLIVEGGYSGFYTQMSFIADGTLVGVEAYE